MNILVIDPVRICSWCGAKSEKIFRAEQVSAQVPYIDFCACGTGHAHLFIDDVVSLYAHLNEPDPQSWHMKHVLTNWTVQQDMASLVDTFLKG